jgi:hypothetical protein
LRSARPPDGVGERHLAPRAADKIGGVAALLLLAALIMAALLGALGGAPHPAHTAQTDSVSLQIEYPKVIRSGEFFEARIAVTPLREIADLTLGVSPALWREHTVNSIVPAPEEETFGKGAYRFSYGPAAAGETFFVKIAFQLNPPLFGGTSGEIAVLDGDEPLASLPLAMKVMP